MKKIAAILWILMSVGCAQTEREASSGAPERAAPSPAAADAFTVVAHRGASSYLPEHSLAAYALGYGQGADYIEPDLVLTRDGVLICVHDLTLERTMAIENVYPDRARENGRWYAIDFTLEELRRVPLHGGFPDAPPGHHVVTFEELVRLVQGLNERTGRRVGILPEIKAPQFYESTPWSIEKEVVSALAEFGYRERDDLAIIQCFDREALLRMREELGCELRMLWLLKELPDPGELARVAGHVDWLGPNRERLEEPGARAFLSEARALDMPVIPWTFLGDLEAMRRFRTELGVSGVFTNNPDVGVRAAGR